MTTITDVSIPSFTGAIVAPGDPDYDDARRVWHGAIDRRPALITRPAGTRDVAVALRYALERDMPFAVRAGGHSLAGFSAIDDGLVIDLRELRRIDIDPGAGRVRVGAGVVWAELDAATQEHGLAVTGGRISDTGVAGLALGSGSGWLERRHGLTTDSLRRATVVTASGEATSGSSPSSSSSCTRWGRRFSADRSCSNTSAAARCCAATARSWRRQTTTSEVAR
jgi:FAD/FMN-containing dehydrogenase